MKRNDPERPQAHSTAERRRRLTPKQRRLLEAIAKQQGIDPEGDGQGVRGEARTQQDAGDDEAKRRRRYGESAAAFDGTRHDTEPVSNLLFHPLRELLVRASSKLGPGLAEWLDKSAYVNLWKDSAADRGPQHSATPETSPSPLVVMRDRGAKTPFFCVHALLGSVFHYHRLASLLDDDQPFYALQAPGLDGVTKPLDSMDAFASLYLDSLREIQPRGPYKLGGYSFGSWIAFEMCNRLIEDGEQVALLAIFGTGVPLSVSVPLAFHQIKFAHEYWEAFAKNILEPFLPYQERMKVSSRRDTHERLPLLLRIVLAHNKAALRFAPRPHPGTVTLFETVDQQLRTPLDTSRGWRHLSSKPVRTYLVSGNHLNMLDEPHVRDLAEKLSACLNSN